MPENYTHLSLDALWTRSTRSIETTDNPRETARQVIGNAAEFCFKAIREAGDKDRAKKRFELLFGSKHGMGGWV